MFEFIETHRGIISLIPIALGLWSIWYLFYRNGLISDQVKNLEDTDRRDKLINEHNSSWTSAYFNGLDWLTQQADRFYGTRWYGWKAFDRCLTLAFLYPLLAALLAWMVANVHSPGGLIIFVDNPNGWSRFWRSLILVGGVVAFGLCFANLDFIAEKIYKMLGKIWPALTKADSFLSKVSAFVSSALALALAVALATENIEAATLVILLYLLLPTSNAFADFLSVRATRTFLRHVGNKRPGLPKIIGLVGLDLCVGLLCLCLLLYVLTSGLDFWAAQSPTTLPLEWRAYFAAAQADWRHGIALWLMALTTLLPTLIHLTMGIAAAVTHKSRLYTSALRDLQIYVDKPDGPSEANYLEIAKRLSRAKLYGWLIVGCPSSR